MINLKIDIIFRLLVFSWWAKVLIDNRRTNYRRYFEAFVEIAVVVYREC